MSSSSASCRNEWKNALCFLPDAGQDPDVVNVTYIKHTAPVRTLSDKIQAYESICDLFEYKIIDKQPSITAHVFLVFKTDSAWWSIEKDSKGITLQRGKDQQSVKEWCKSTPRKGKLVETRKDKGRITIGELIDWLYQKEELTKGYHWWKNNCKKFARDAFACALKTGEFTAI